MSEVKKPYHITDGKLDNLFREHLDDCYSDVEILCGLSYSPSYALYHIDPIAYRVEFSNWLSFETEEDRFVYEGSEYYWKEDWDDYLEELEWEQEEE